MIPPRSRYRPLFDRHPSSLARRVSTTWIYGFALACLALGWLGPAWGPTTWAQQPEATSPDPATDEARDPLAENGSEEATDEGTEGDGTEGDGTEGDGTEGDGTEIDAGGKTVLLGKIHSDIGLSESAYLTRLLEEAETLGVDTLVIDLNTFGGRVDAAVAMRDALLDADLETVMFINRRAISAGALLALACNRIAITPGGTIGAATPITAGAGGDMPQPVEEKYLSYFRQEMRVTAEARGRDGDVAAAMVDADNEVEGVSDKGKVLTLTTRSALETGIADFEADDLDAVLAEIGASAGDLRTFERSWSEELVGFLTSPSIASLLLLGMMIGGYLEFQTPGFGLFGGVAIFCFLLLYFSHYMVNLAGHEELLLFVLGVILLGVELFVFPGLGIFAALGAASVLAATVLLLMAGDWSDLSFENPFTVEAAAQVALAILVGAGLTLLLARFVAPVEGESSRGGLLLRTDLATADGFTSHAPVPEESSLVGSVGKALSELRPSGKALIEGQRLNVETEGDWIERGDDVVVIRRTEGRIVVRRA